MYVGTVRATPEAAPPSITEAAEAAAVAAVSDAAQALGFRHLPIADPPADREGSSRLVLLMVGPAGGTSLDLVGSVGGDGSQLRFSVRNLAGGSETPELAAAFEAIREALARALPGYRLEVVKGSHARVFAP